MKKYIRASFDSSMPEWLRNDEWAIKKLNEAGVDLANCIFSRTKQGKVDDNYAVYLVKGTTYGDAYKPFVWIPGVYNDDEYVEDAPQYNYRIGQRMPKSAQIKYMPKKYLNIEDTVYIYKATNGKPRKEHYKDPRYGSEWRGGKEEYAGQYYMPEKKNYKGEITQEAGWSKEGKFRGRDKSGYVIPNPKDRLEKFHNSPEGKTRQAEKCRKQLEQIYGQLVSLKEELLGNLNSASLDAFGSYYKSLDYFNDALNYYKEALNYITPQNHWGTENYIDPESALHSAARAQDRLDTARRILEGKYW